MTPMFDVRWPSMSSCPRCNQALSAGVETARINIESVSHLAKNNWDSGQEKSCNRVYRKVVASWWCRKEQKAVSPSGGNHDITAAIKPAIRFIQLVTYQYKRYQCEKRLMGQETELAAPWQSSYRWALPGWSKDQLLAERPIGIKGTWSTMNHLFPVRHVTVVSGRGIAIKGIRWWWLVASASLLDSTYAAFCWGVIQPWHASDSRHLYVGTECQIL